MLFHNYKQRVLNIAKSNLILFHLQDEKTGLVSVDYSPQGNNGVYSGVSLNNTIGPDGRSAPFYDGVNDLNTFPLANFMADFNMDEHSIVIWAKAYNAGVWTDGTTRPLIVIATRDTSDSDIIQIVKHATNNTLMYLIDRVDGDDETKALTISNTSWFSVGISLSLSGDYVKYYCNGILLETDTGITASRLTAPYLARVGGWGSYWYGWIGPVMVWNTPISDAQHSILGRI